VIDVHKIYLGGPVASPGNFSGVRGLHHEFFSGGGVFTPGFFLGGCLHQDFLGGGLNQEFLGGFTPEFFFGGFTPGFFSGWSLHRNFFPERGVSTNSVEDRGQRKWGSGGGSTLVRGFTEFANE
jgi:hypothetical protein